MSKAEELLGDLMVALRDFHPPTYSNWVVENGKVYVAEIGGFHSDRRPLLISQPISEFVAENVSRVADEDITLAHRAVEMGFIDPDELDPWSRETAQAWEAHYDIDLMEAHNE